MPKSSLEQGLEEVSLMHAHTWKAWALSTGERCLDPDGFTDEFPDKPLEGAGAELEEVDTGAHL